LRTLLLTVALFGAYLGLFRWMRRATPAQFGGLMLVLLAVVYPLAFRAIFRPYGRLRHGRRAAETDLDGRADESDQKGLEEK
jgi:hypothetical protein